MWAKLDITGGVVRTRRAQALDPGEFVQVTNARLKPGDAAQLHNDVGYQTFGTPNNPVVAGPFYLSFESSTDKILVVTTAGGTSYLETADAGASGTFTSIQTITGTVTAAHVVHRGDQYFVGTDQGNYVIQDNVSRSMGMTYLSTALGMTVTTPAGSSAAALSDAFRYTLTEYDSTNDIESEPSITTSFTIDQAGDTVSLDWTATFVQQNSNADKIRIYRHYYGNGTNAFLQSTEENTPGNTYYDNRLWLGGLVAEQAIATTTYSDALNTVQDPAISYPLVKTDEIFGGAIYAFLQRTRNFTMGAIFNDALVVNEPATGKQILRYSPPGYPEYQPDPYFTYFASDDSDEIVGLHNLNNRLLVLTTGGVHRVNYLPTAGDLSAEQGRTQEVVTGRVGCLGRYASCKVETERGELAVWVSARGLEWSDGLGWSDACPDFTSADITTTDAVLVNNRKLYRLELYSAGERWDFYYHPTLMKGGKLRLIGPSTAPASALKGRCANNDYVWVASSSTVYAVNAGNSATSTTVETGHLVGSQPMSELSILSLALTHSAMAADTVSVQVHGKHLGSDEIGSSTLRMPSADKQETGKIDIQHSGQYLRVTWTLSDTGAWSAGPSWVDIEAREGG